MRRGGDSFGKRLWARLVNDRANGARVFITGGGHRTTVALLCGGERIDLRGAVNRLAGARERTSGLQSCSTR